MPVGPSSSGRDGRLGRFFHEMRSRNVKFSAIAKRKTCHFFPEIITFHFSLHFLNIEIKIWLPKRKRFLWRRILVSTNLFIFCQSASYLNECVAIFKYFWYFCRFIHIKQRLLSMKSLPITCSLKKAFLKLKC